MADVTCPKCADVVNSRGLAGHLRFKHKVKPGKAIHDLFKLALPKEVSSDPDYNDIVTGMDKMRDICERAQELKWMYYHKKLLITEEELKKLLSVLRDEYAKAASGVWWRRDTESHREGDAIVFDVPYDKSKNPRDNGYVPIVEAKDASDWSNFDYSEKDKKDFEDDDRGTERRGLLGLMYKQSDFDKRMKQKYG